MMDVLKQAGLAHNPDHNWGDSIGMLLIINSSHQGECVVATDLLNGAPDNLTVMTETPVQMAILQCKKADGMVSNRRECTPACLLYA